MNIAQLIEELEYLKETVGDDADKNRDEKKHLRETMTKIVKAFEGDTEAQEKILQVVYGQGHDGHLMRRLTNVING